MKNLSFVKSRRGTQPHLKLRKGLARPLFFYTALVKVLCILHLERHIKFASMSNLVVLGWADEKNDV